MANPLVGTAYTPQKKLTLSVAVTVLLVLMVSLVQPFGATSAHAIDDGRDINWHIRDGAAGYNNMINQVRARAASRVVYDKMDMTTGDANDYFSVNVWESSLDGNVPSVRLIVRAENLYIQGVYVPDLSYYYHFGDATAKSYLPTSIASNLQLPFSGDYLSMTRYANQTMTTPRFRAFDMSRNAGILRAQNSRGFERAGALLSFVEAISEGARFSYISNRIASNWNTGTTFDLNSVDMVRNWASLTSWTRNRLAHGSATPEYGWIGDQHIQTLSNVAAIAALLLFWKG
ncbi:ribosome-inactivating family protein [Streptomyces prunicolor]|uniref:ribosome-inactivating family protein n=1 Tax=Streptomyces prunicolor TaxID=67348 RepID=UPI0009964DF2|nr:ribosome-inactivating family protein [Streptomyces prunicolor]